MYPGTCQTSKPMIKIEVRNSAGTVIASQNGEVLFGSAVAEMENLVPGTYTIEWVHTWMTNSVKEYTVRTISPVPTSMTGSKTQEYGMKG